MKPYQDRKRMARKENGIECFNRALETYAEENINAPDLADKETMCLDFMIAFMQMCEKEDINFEQIVRCARIETERERVPV